MADIRVEFNNNEVLNFDSYTYNKYEENLRLILHNPVDVDSVINKILQYGTDLIKLEINYPNRSITHTLYGYEILKYDLRTGYNGKALYILFERKKQNE